MEGAARWDGAGWSALGSGPGGSVRSLLSFDDGGGPALYAGGILPKEIAKWDGAGWSPLGSGVNSHVYTMTAFDDGSGPALYAGGNFTHAGGLLVRCLAKWDGAVWSPLGGGLGSGLANYAYSTAVFDDGSGPALYVGGMFTSASGGPGNRIAKWDGATWSALGSGANDTVLALAMFDDGSGPVLHAAGLFTSAGGVPANRIAKWDGATWSALGSGVNGQVQTLAVYDDGSGPALYAGGFFTTAGGTPASRIAKWDGAIWSGLDSGITFAGVNALAEFNDGFGSALYAGGSFTSSASGDSFLARYGCAFPSPPGCAGNPAALSALAPSAPLGAPLPLRVAGAAAQSGLGIVYFGASGVDAGGCGLILTGLGEILLAVAPPPHLAASGPLAGGICDLLPFVPATPSLSGATAWLQGAALDLSLANPVELSNALAVTLGP